MAVSVHQLIGGREVMIAEFFTPEVDALVEKAARLHRGKCEDAVFDYLCSTCADLGWTEEQHGLQVPTNQHILELLRMPLTVAAVLHDVSRNLGIEPHPLILQALGVPESELAAD